MKPDLLVVPEDVGAGALEFHQLDALVDAGAAAARTALDDLARPVRPAAAPEPPAPPAPETQRTPVLD